VNSAGVLKNSPIGAQPIEDMELLHVSWCVCFVLLTDCCVAVMRWLCLCYSLAVAWQV
jgi:hypothetical protein